ncbi:uncharacterized protein LOC128548179 [Mercenaria mercenaria]|uniref:uncharacterized protein LOC128548179 n=1 Tax=Mercenaria mercenaria TaxID=6596 RepID=UPI00234FA080|nr:uncharacterized protein LOC128548179 [Mercenaria mercenaria]
MAIENVKCENIYAGSLGKCLVYEWKTDWGSDLTTREFAQVHKRDRIITHYATDEGALAKSSPAVTLYDLDFRNNDFDKGILAIRPLLSAGNQVCFIAHPDKFWHGTVNAVTKRHGMTVSAPVTSSNYYKLKKLLPSDLDPLSIQSIADFCNVDSDHIFYMETISFNSYKGYSKKLKVNGIFGRLCVGIPKRFTSTVFGN